ncbi:MAG: amidohydrolase family protein [Firmicutes bacterium]|nr:amidohydrolase family protein [Bacillota bacterium]
MDLKSIPIVDSHCHLFDLAFKKRNLAGLLSLSLEQWDVKHLEDTLIYKRFIKALAEFYEISCDEAEVLKARERTCERDYRGYVKNLFEHAGITDVVVDLGYKPAEVNIQDFKDFVPCNVHYVFRIETLLDKLWEQKRDFNEALELFRTTLYKQVETGVVAFKSIIGYRTGIKVTVPDYKEAKKAYEIENNEKIFRDFFFNETIRICKQVDLPFQIHAAFGESNVNILNNNPLLLKNILDEQAYKDVKMVLVHGGYPYSFEAGYLVAMYPNLYLDFSEMIPWLTFDAKHGLKKILDMAPFSKVMYGSDGYIVPEIHFFGAVEGKRILGEIIGELVKSKILSESQGLELAESVLYKNAKAIFKI